MRLHVCRCRILPSRIVLFSWSSPSTSFSPVPSPDPQKFARNRIRPVPAPLLCARAGIVYSQRFLPTLLFHGKIRYIRLIFPLHLLVCLEDPNVDNNCCRLVYVPQSSTRPLSNLQYHMTNYVLRPSMLLPCFSPSAYTSATKWKP